MSDEIKLRWETVTRWILRSALGVISIVCAIVGNAAVDVLSEMRTDVKILLNEHVRLEGRVNAVEARTTKVENDVDKIRDFKTK